MTREEAHSLFRSGMASDCLSDDAEINLIDKIYDDGYQIVKLEEK